ncbi:alanine racemase [Longimicrobium sp.]|uniref:alanine racemase n=1 Tax=Longimicrobium sp. TaxID=2029185 RepID=UPI002E31757B|nr:alanine racemase [Longimicrobium sp.]HEX6040113.1 alanine racemase [Longimicrobium sp.]
MVSRAWVEVDEAALRRNLRRVKDAAGPAASVVPMLKADAYGLGVADVLRIVQAELDPRELWAIGVAAVAEGEQLRDLGWTGRVVVFAAQPPGEFLRAARAGLTPALSDLDGVRRWAHAARETGRRLAFHAEIDTGMGRAGFPFADAAAWGREADALAGDLLTWEGCFTHFHSADEPDLGPTDEQQRRFMRALEALPPPRDGTERRVIHSANSAAALRRNGFGLDLVRPGIFLYGGAAGPDARPEEVASVRARVALVRDVPAGWSCGYGATYTSRRPERWGTLSIGYGDGLPRRLSPAGGEALVRGRRVPIIGRVSMDMTVVDLTDVPGAQAGDVATLIGTDGGEHIGLEEVAGRCGTISYEILTGLGARMPRVYVNGTRSPGPA